MIFSTFSTVYISGFSLSNLVPSHSLYFFPCCLASTLLLLPLLLHNSPLISFLFSSFPLLPADAQCQAATAWVTSVGSTPHTVVPMGVRWQPADRRRVSLMAHPSTGRPSRQRGLLVPPQVVMAPDTLTEVSSHTAGKLHADRMVSCGTVLGSPNEKTQKQIHGSSSNFPAQDFLCITCSFK